MRQTLIPHPDLPHPPLRIDVEVRRPAPGRLRLLYAVTGPIADLSVPPPGALIRAGALWEHTCFEAFLGAGSGYFEFNFAPSRAWAAYRFDSPRGGMREAAIAQPRIETRSDARNLELSATIDIDPDATAGRLGLAAVIEEKSGRRSWWALTHPPGDPDFHHQTCFTLGLPAAETP